MKTNKVYAGGTLMTKQVTGSNPLGNRHDSLVLAENIRRYYHRQGFNRVKVWVEFLSDPTDHWAIRSNIKFAV